jgi:hypothetical protein
MLAPIGKYNVEKVLGEGGFGVVYLAFDPDVGQPVAIKKLRAAGDPDLLKRFQMEIRTTASLRHKNIVTIHASGEDAGDPYLVMEFLEGSTLKQVIREGRTLTLLEKVRIMTQVADGLAYANAKGVVHRDVKPENIMLLPDDTVKIMDFGIALGPNRNTAVTQTGGIIGTPPYFAPEQLEGHKATEQTDIFSYGDVYYELLTGSHPFEQSKGDWRALQLAILTREPRSVGDLVPGCPEALELLVHRTLAKSPEIRYQKFEEVQLDNEAILVDLRHEGAAAILRAVRPLIESGDLQTAQGRINKAYQLEPGNREVRRLREEINLRMQREQVQARVEGLLQNAATQMAERRFAEAVQNLESANKIDSTNVLIGTRLEEARARLENSNRANRLISEGRLNQQKGMLDEALRLFESALGIDPDHTEARRLVARVSGELDRRRRHERLQKAMASAREHLTAKRFAAALDIVGDIEREQPDATWLADLRAEIQRAQAEEESRLRAERFELALGQARTALQAGDLERAAPLMDQLFANFAAEPGAAEVLRLLQQQFQAQVRAREIAHYQHLASGLLRDKSSEAALALLADALAKFPDDAGLQRLNQSALDLFREQQRGEAIAAAIKEAGTKRVNGDLQGALNTVLEARRSLGEDAAFVGLMRQLQKEIELQRYRSGLERLLQDGRRLMAAGRVAEAIDQIQNAKEFAAESEVRALLDAARAAAAIELEKRFVAETLAAAENLESRALWSQALETVERALARYPHDSRLAQVVERLRQRVEWEHSRAAIEEHRAAIQLEIERADWSRASAALERACSEFPGERAFDDLASRMQAEEFDAALKDLEARVRQNLAANEVDQAEQELNATRTMYAGDRRWDFLVQEVARRKEYETVLLEVERQRDARRFSEAERMLTEIIKQGAPDQRADHIRDAIRAQRSEALRQAEIARIAAEIREELKRDNASQATAELAAARSRYPGEDVWTELQADVDARQQAFQRQSDVAAAEQNIRQLLSRNDVQQAASVLLSARTKYPGEAQWAILEAEIAARREEMQRQQEIAAIEAIVHGGLDREISSILLAEVEAPAGTYAIAPVWDALRRVSSRLDQARTKYPGETVWENLAAELAGQQAQLERKITEVVRSGSGLLSLDWNARQLNAARARYPGEPFWTALESEIGALREKLRLASIADFEAQIEDCLRRSDFESARKHLDTARQKHPGERRWEELQREVEAGRAQRKRQEELAAAQKTIREELARVDQIPQRRDWVNPIELQWEALQRAAVVLSEARAKYPDETKLTALQAEIETRRSRWQNEISQSVTKAVEDHPHREIAKTFGPQIGALLKRDPNEPLWARLKAEIDALEAVLNRNDAVAAAGERVRQCLRRNDLRQAGAELDAARAAYANEPLWETLDTEIAAAKALEDQRRREARDRDRDRLTAISRQMETETRRRRRKDLASEARKVAAAYVDDPEMASMAAAIEALVEKPRVETPHEELPKRAPLPWKWVAGGAVAAVAAAVVIFGVVRKPSAPAVPRSSATISIEIRTDPPGASVRVADRTCVTPNCRLDLKTGNYPVEARLDGYETRQQTVTVDTANRLVDWTLQPVRVPPPPPSAGIGTLVIRTGVPDALIYIDNVPQPTRTDQSGAVTLSLEAKAHQVRVERNQYQQLPARRVSIAVGSQQTLEFRMVPESARLELIGAPANLELHVDGKRSAFPAAVQPGEHTLEVSQGTLQPAQGSASSSLTQRFEPGQRVILTWKSPAPTAPTPVTPPSLPPSVNPPTVTTAGGTKGPTPEETQEDRDWARIQENMDLARLREFRRKYPDGRHAKDADNAINHLDEPAWSRSNKENAASLQGYLTDFPNGLHASEAASRVDELLWKAVDPAEIEQVRRFAKEHPTSAHFREAQRILDRFDERQELYRAEINGAIARLDQAIAKKPVNERDLKGIWTGNDPSKRTLLEALKTTGQQFNFTEPEPANIRSDTTATVRCIMTNTLAKPQNVSITLRKVNGVWMIVSFSNSE